MTPDLARLAAALAALTAGMPPPRRILDVGCGTFASADVLRARFPAALVCGLDRDGDVLQFAPPWPGPAGCVIVADGAWLPFAPTPGFDLILVRHPDVDRRREGWQRVGVALAACLAAEGRIVVSCYSPHEADVLRAVLLRVGLEMLPLDQKILPPANLAGQDRVVLGLARATNPVRAGFSAPIPAGSPESWRSSP